MSVKISPFAFADFHAFVLNIKKESTQAGEATSPIDADYGMDASVNNITHSLQIVKSKAL